MQIKDNVDLFRHNVAENFVMGNKYMFLWARELLKK